jgi:TRAP-type C4-dicarboxylate transport system permease small subunit
MKIFGPVCNGLEKAIENLSSIIVVILTVFIGIEVVSRYLVGRSYGFLEEFSCWMMVWFSFLSAGVLLRRNHHIRIDLLEDRLNARGKAILAILSSITSLIAGVWFAWAGILTCVKAYQNQELPMSSLGIPLYLVRLALPIGMVCLVIFSIELLSKNIHSLCLLRKGR